ncbi:DUF1987 domain-containing protein [Magnetospira thiophila]
MENIKVGATDRSPEVDFDFASNIFSLRGESYPEDVTAFYGPMVAQLEEHLAKLNGATVQFNFELIYFNSSSAKILMGLFDLLDETAGNGNSVTITWTYESDDDNMQELGEEFGEDLENATFELKEIEA